ncbi:MAG: class I fructose-bisphosphate aldolase [Patescibacteria group bacterium]
MIKNTMISGFKKRLNQGRDKKFSISSETFSPKKRAFLRNISLNNSRFMILPIDQGLEHGPSDFLVNPDCGDPEYQLEIAKKVGYSAIAMQVGLARKYWQKAKYRKCVPLVLKVNGKTRIPKETEEFSPLNATVEDAVALGAQGIGYTLFVGSGRQSEDFAQLRDLRIEADKYDLPIIIWAYPRGSVVAADGGKNSIAAVDYAVRVAMELGADVVKFNMPTFPKPGFQSDGVFSEYNIFKDWKQKELLAKVVATAGEMGTILSGGDYVDDKILLSNVKVAVECGIDGVIFGRNIWQRKFEEAVGMAGKIKQILLNS